MANFDKSFNKLILTEGGYVNDPADRGGETYLGISRVHHPDSLMWPIIDDVKKIYGTKNINTRLKSNSSITKEVKDIYKKEYWDKFRLDEIASQRIAHEIFDDAVNRGVKAATKTLQLILDLDITGKFDDNLFNELLKYAKK